MLLNALLALQVTLALCSGLVWVRNAWVHRERIRVLRECEEKNDLTEYARLEPYNAMMLRWWVWDIEKFKRG